MSNESERFVVPENILSQQVNDEMVLFNLETEVYFSLDAVGARFFDILKSGDDYESMLNALEDEFDVDRNRLKNDFNALVEKLLEKKLLARG